MLDMLLFAFANKSELVNSILHAYEFLPSVVNSACQPVPTGHPLCKNTLSIFTYSYGVCFALSLFKNNDQPFPLESLVLKFKNFILNFMLELTLKIFL